MIIDIVKELNRFDSAVPIERAWTPPASWYTRPEFYEAEQTRVFGKNWVIGARSDEVEKPRSFVCGEIAGERYVIVRGEDNVLRAFFNVCRHHAAAVAEGCGETKRFVCPYHGWTYGLDGQLLNAPELGGVEDFEKNRFGLPPIAARQWGPFVFISMAQAPRLLEEDLSPLAAVLGSTNYDTLRFVTRREYTLNCNWKVYVDNYLDGGYHVVYLHRGLASQLDLASYKTEIYGRFSIQSSSGIGAATLQKGGMSNVEAGSDFAERIGDSAVYAWVYPNLMINRYGSIMDTNWVIPLGHDRTKVIFDYYFLASSANDEFVTKSIAASDIVQNEDMDICEAVQRGLTSRSYDRGRYSSTREMGEFHFHKLLADDMRSGDAP